MMPTVNVPGVAARFKSRPLEPPRTLITKYRNVAEETNVRCNELQRMTSPDMMRANARAKVECKRNFLYWIEMQMYPAIVL